MASVIITLFPFIILFDLLFGDIVALKLPGRLIRAFNLSIMSCELGT